MCSYGTDRQCRDGCNFRSPHSSSFHFELENEFTTIISVRDVTDCRIDLLIVCNVMGWK